MMVPLRGIFSAILLSALYFSTPSIAQVPPQPLPTRPLPPQPVSDSVETLLPRAEAGDIDAQVELGHLYSDHQQWAQAIHWFTRAADAGHVGAMLELSYFYGIGLGVPIDREKAIMYESRAMEAGDNTAKNNLAYDLALEERDLDRALALVTEALAAEPDIDSYLDTQGWVLYKMKRYQAALQPLCRAARKDGGDAEIASHLGDALWQAGFRAEATETWKLASALLTDPKLQSDSGSKLATSAFGQEISAELQRKLISPESVLGTGPDQPVAALPQECAPPTS